MVADVLKTAREIIEDRVKRYPDSSFYTYAGREMARIDSYLAGVRRPDRPFYESLTHGIGLMCTRELDASDPEFCDAVDGMLEEIRVRTT